MIILMDGGPDQLYWQAFKKRQQSRCKLWGLSPNRKATSLWVASLKAKKEAETGDLLSVKDLSDMFALHQSDMAGASKRTDMADGFVKDCIFVFEKNAIWSSVQLLPRHLGREVWPVIPVEFTSENESDNWEGGIHSDQVGPQVKSLN